MVLLVAGGCEIGLPTPGLDTPATAPPDHVLEVDRVRRRHPWDEIRTAIAAPGDIDGDGGEDLVLVTTSESSVWWYRGGSALDSEADAVLDVVDVPRSDPFLLTPGDLDGDGLADMALPLERRSMALLLGSADGPQAGPPIDLSSFDLRAVGVAGDVDGDGVGGLAVASLRLGSGWLGIYEGTSGEPEQEVSLEGGRVDWATGMGDTDGDGYVDLLVEHDHGVRLLFGGAAGLDPADSVHVPMSDPEAAWRAGDADGDGLADAIVLDGGVWFFLPGDPSGLGQPVSWWTPRASEPEPEALAAAGDVDGDGADDFFVGWPDVDLGQGGVLGFFGSPAGPGADPGLAFGGGVAGAHLGDGLAAGVDLDGDGRSDLAATAETAGVGASSEVGLEVRVWSGVRPD